MAFAEGGKEAAEWQFEGVPQGVPGGEGSDGAALLDFDESASGQAGSGGKLVVGPAALAPQSRELEA
ncbi:hypothetical protein GCM10010497_59940 [Streptomyces cinereoruber]|uniref:Uncharacterized protein n=1 Tax=Streptomyces cinereoruber TaxID=67260 RepID=A0AAV4KQN1_9ACTN|nr:hypothetical protein GCM10010497_59940 [Streptomyces cinereoruber]